MKIICNTPGKGRLKNPYQAQDYATFGSYAAKREAFEAIVQTYDAFYSDHTTPLPVGEWDVELVEEEFNTFANKWQSDTGYFVSKRQSYIYISPLPPAQPVKAVEEEKEYKPYRLTVYNTIYNKTVDIIQDGDKIVLTHQQAIDLANEILTNIKVKK